MIRAANRLVPRNERRVRSIRNIAVLTTVGLATLVVVLAHACPGYAASSVAVDNSGAAVDAVVGGQSTEPAQLVRMGHRGGGHTFRAGEFRSFGVTRFNRFNRFHFRYLLASLRIILIITYAAP
jgi:hypothetical protein